MTLRQYLIVMTIATILCWISWGMVMMNIDPFHVSLSGFLFFYLSLAFALVGTIAMLSFGWQALVRRQDAPMFRIVRKSFHIALIASLAIVGILTLQGAGLLRLWNALALIATGAVFAAFRQSVRRPQMTESTHVRTSL